MESEAKTMAYVREHGFPVPFVEEISDDGCDLVMERIEGPSMVEAISKAPWTVRRQGTLLADLHRRLHEVTPPDFLPPGPIGAGSALLHLDLHPLNVIIGPSGPVVIDWPNAALGDPAVDVALAWLLMSAGEIPGGSMKVKLLGWGRTLLVNGFMDRFDRKQITTQLRPAVEWKAKDPHMSPKEIEAMWHLVERAEATEIPGRSPGQT